MFARPAPGWVLWLVLPWIPLWLVMWMVFVFYGGEIVEFFGGGVLPLLTQDTLELTVVFITNLGVYAFVQIQRGIRLRYGSCTLSRDVLIFEPGMVKTGHSQSQVVVSLSAISAWEETDHGFVVKATDRNPAAALLIPLLIPAVADSDRAEVAAFLRRAPDAGDDGTSPAV